MCARSTMRARHAFILVFFRDLKRICSRAISMYHPELTCGHKWYAWTHRPPPLTSSMRLLRLRGVNWHQSPQCNIQLPHFLHMYPAILHWLANAGKYCLFVGRSCLTYDIRGQFGVYFHHVPTIYVSISPFGQQSLHWLVNPGKHCLLVDRSLTCSIARV